MYPPIVIFQSSYGGFMLSKDLLAELGLIEDKDFEIWDFEPIFQNCLKPGTRQLFITGSFSGRSEGVAEMVQTARDYNLELVTVSFSTLKIDGPFDHHIPKTVLGTRKSFMEAVKGFLNGTINRTNCR